MSRTEGLISPDGAVISHETTDVRRIGTNVEVAGNKVFIKPDPFSKYNFFVNQYNHPANRVGENYYQQVPYFFGMDLRNRCQICVALICCLIPFVCFLMFAVGVARLVSFIIVILRVQANRQLVRNPYQNMVYMSGVYADINEYFNVQSIHQITQLSLHGVSTQNIAAAQARLQQRVALGETQKIMVFTDAFARYESGVLQGMSIRIFLSVVFIGLSIVGMIFTYGTIFN